MGQENAIAGVSGHNGWAILVCVALRAGRPVVVDRRRAPLIEVGLPNQPYEHDTFDLDPVRAQELVNQVHESAIRCAERELGRLSVSGERKILAIAMRDALLPGLPESVAAAHASSAVMVRADPMMYHDALCRAAATLGITVELIPRGQEIRSAAEALGTTAEHLEEWLMDLRVGLGPPWQRDHRDATARAIAAWGKFAKLKLPAGIKPRT